MEIKIDTNFRIRNSFNSGCSIIRPNAAKTLTSQNVRTNTDTFKSSGTSYYSSHREQINSFTESIHNAVELDRVSISRDDHEGMTKFNFEWISKCENGLNKNIPEKLEAAGIPKDMKFEFDFALDSDKIEITGISDEKYCDMVEEILGSSKTAITFMSCASRVMNGYISSLYYSWVSKSLDRCFGQDINELYIDENGNLGGVNDDLKEALNAVKIAEKKGEPFDVNYEYGFPAVKNNIEGIVKRMAADKNITPNISHMGYDGERIFTNDGEFKFGKDFDPGLFGEEKYLMRGTMALYMTVYGRYNSWLENEEKFY